MIALIDNDKFIRLSWTLKAKQNGVLFHAFSSINDFIVQALNKETTVYIDSNLDNGIKGEIESEMISNLGFKKIYLTTGYDDLILSDYPWIIGIVSKSPPF